MINNDVRDWRGEVVGFRCTSCGKIYQTGWGDICNQCRKEEKRFQDLVKTIKGTTDG